MTTLREKKTPVWGQFKRAELAIAGVLVVLVGLLFWRPVAARLLGNIGALYLDRVLLPAELPAGEREARLSAARFFLEQSLSLDEEPLMRRRLGRAYLAGGEEDAALAQWRHDPGAANYLSSFGAWQAGQGQPAAAVGAYAAAVHLDPTTTTLYVQLVQILRSENRLDEAIRWGELGRQRDQNNIMLRFHLGLAYLEANRPAEAVPVWRELVALAPANVDYALLLGTALVRADRTAEGVTQYRQAIQRLAPEDTSALTDGDFLRIGQTLSNFGYWPEAIVALERSVAMVPNNAYSHALLGWAYYKDAKGSVLAVAELERAQQLDPNLVMTYVRLSELWRQEKNLAEADRWALAGTQQLPNSADVWLALAIVRYEQNRVEAAREPVERAIALSPDSASARFWAGLVYSRLGQPAVAATHLQEAVRLNPLAVDYGLALGDVYLALGQRDAALKEFQRLAQLASDDIRVQDWLRRLQ